MASQPTVRSLIFRREKDATDDRMGTLVEALGKNEESRLMIEQQLGGK